MTPAFGRGTSFLACASAVLLLTIVACQQTPVSAKPVTSKGSAIPDSADQVIFGLRMTMNDQSVSKGILLSDTAFMYDDATRVVMRRVNVTFFTPQGVRDGVMTSRAGVYNSRLSRLEATGDVVVIRDDGKRLTSQQLVYDQQRNQIYTDSAFVLNEPDRQITGIGFESDPKMTSFRCLRACKAVAPVQIPRE
ncbi:MAG: LPS export ABC transporter periplasmic protein LptC [Gemmatimonadaceae bacterium]|nr:LPS export ABC transporter periplasmic protein LptC [Gemmatimonadaceae bacterium]